MPTARRMGSSRSAGSWAIAPSTYYRHLARQLDPTKRSARARHDEVVNAIILRVWQQQQQRVYGSRKVWKQMGREGLHEARCRVRRLMRDLGLVGATRGAWTTTTHADDTRARPADFVARRFVATCPNQFWVSDFTYVATWQGFIYVALAGCGRRRDAHVGGLV